MSWDPLQREILEALGHVVYAVEGSAAAAPVAARADGGEASGMHAGPVSDPLLRALLRAAGRAADDPEAVALCRDLLPPGGLGDVASRRALWPRLRALRARPAR